MSQFGDDLPMIDATRNMWIEIIQPDVDKAKPGDPTCCVAALACKRLRGCREARVYKSRVYIKTNKKWLRFEAPRALRGEEIVFDRGGGFQLGKYLLRKVCPSSRTGQRQGTNSAKKTLKKRTTRRHIVIGARPNAPVGT